MGAFKFDHQPLLAPGRHQMPLWQVEQLCVVGFPGSVIRPDLFRKLERFVAAFEAARIRCDMLVNGSFMTEKLEPSDVDVAVLLDPYVADNLDLRQEMLVDSVNDDMFIEGVDGFVETLFPLGHASYRADGNEMLWSEQYGREHNGEYLKGIAVLRVGETDVGLRICR